MTLIGYCRRLTVTELEYGHHLVWYVPAVRVMLIDDCYYVINSGTCQHVISFIPGTVDSSLYVRYVGMW